LKKNKNKKKKENSYRVLWQRRRKKIKNPKLLL